VIQPATLKYSHRHRPGLHWLGFPIFLMMSWILSRGVSLAAHPSTNLLLWVLVMAGLGLLAWWASSVIVEVDYVEFRCGWDYLPFWRRIPLVEITGIDVTRITYLESIWQQLVWKTKANMPIGQSGVVVLYLTGGGTYQIGTDEPHQLAAAVRARLSPPGT
jgi:hypothetical protein